MGHLPTNDFMACTLGRTIINDVANFESVYICGHQCVNQTRGILVTMASCHVIRFTTIVNVSGFC